MTASSKQNEVVEDSCRDKLPPSCMPNHTGFAVGFTSKYSCERTELVLITPFLLTNCFCGDADIIQEFVDSLATTYRGRLKQGEKRIS